MRLKLLAERMSQTIRPGVTGRIRTDVRYFEPPDLAAAIRSTEASAGGIKAREILNDPNSAQDLRDMAQEMLRMSRNASMQLVLNASNPMVRRLSQQNFENPDIISLMRGIYNSAILYNQEFMTPQNARVFYEQYQKLMNRSLDYIIEQKDLERQATALEQERQALRKDKKQEEESKHLIFFLMTPLDESYQPFIEAVRAVIEEQLGCQLFVASDRQYKDMVIDNVRTHMNQAHAFLAEVTDANPNVMFELGAARFDLRERPIVLMRKQSGQQLPVDLHGRIYVDYEEKTGKALTDYLAAQLRADQRIKSLLNQKGRERYISPKSLKEMLPVLQIKDKIWQALAEQYPTQEAWQNASEATVEKLLGKDNGDLANVILNRIQASVAGGQR